MIDCLNESTEGLVNEFENFKFQGKKKEKSILFCFRKLEPTVRSNKNRDFVHLSNGFLMLFQQWAVIISEVSASCENLKKI